MFGTGAIVDGDTLTLYYGAADTLVCGATLSIQAILRSRVRPYAQEERRECII